MAVLTLLGVFVGDVIAPAVSGLLPILARSASVGFSPTEWSLAGVIRLTLGFHMSITILGAVGGLAGFLVGRRI